MKLVRSHLLLAVFITTCTLAVNAQWNDCIATIQNGTIIGGTVNTVDPSRKVCAYLGVPYASPPVGVLRFKPPQPAPAFGSMIGITPPNICPQGGVAPPGWKIAEDCLYLNVYQPKNASSANLPVMIWFHGGSFTSGSAELYSPSRLLARGDVILVVVHYRLGLLGFLSTGDEVAPGNYGLKDQQFSIRWVHENIQAFGGNPQQVTIFGESAGAASAIFQLLSPLNKGLIHGVIAQSGTALTTWAMDVEPAAEQAKFMARRLGCTTESSHLMVDCLSKIHWSVIVLAQGLFTAEYWGKMTYPYATITPVVEPDLPGAFISKDPMEIMKNGEIDNIPVMLGANKHDGSFVLASVYIATIGPQRLDQNPQYMRDQLVPDLLKFFRIQGDSANRAAASSVEVAYLDGVRRSSWNESMPGLVDIATVFLYKSAAQHTADLLSRRGIKVYLYSFEHHSHNSLWPFFFGPIGSTIPIEPGISHADELMYLFHLPAQFSPEDQTFSEKFCDLWINFGKTGNPTPSPTDDYDEWPVYNTLDESYMKLNITPTAMSRYRSSWRVNGFEWN